jgi:hypothetical protein
VIFFITLVDQSDGDRHSIFWDYRVLRFRELQFDWILTGVHSWHL